MHSTCTDRTTKAARRYISPRTRTLTRGEAETRALAYAIKSATCDEELVEAAARAMATLIEGESGYLIPVPDHNGETEANKRLADFIALFTGYRFHVSDALTRTAPTESACERHKKRLPALAIQSHNIARRAQQKIKLSADGSDRIYFVDNVITSGTTIAACKEAFYGLGTGLVYADAHNDQPN
jgi:predicted amidophosphoribosyltransferase